MKDEPSMQLGRMAKHNADELLSLIYRLYPTSGWSRESMKWQYFDNPVGEACCWVAWDSQRIVANYTAIPHRMHLKGKLATGWRVQNVVTDPDYQGRGLYAALSHLACEFLMTPDFPLNFTFPNENSHPMFLKCGWINPNRIPLWILDGVQKRSFQKISAIANPIQYFGEDEEEIWHAYARTIDYAIDRSAAYLNWRYLANPTAKYFPFRLNVKGKTLILVLKYYDRENGERWAHICDWFTDEPNPLVAESAVGFALNFALSLGCKALSCWNFPGNTLEPALLANGFVLQKELTRWQVLNANSKELNVTEVSSPQRWHLTMGDTDVY